MPTDILRTQPITWSTIRIMGLTREQIGIAIRLLILSRDGIGWYVPALSEYAARDACLALREHGLVLSQWRKDPATSVESDGYSLNQFGLAVATFLVANEDQIDDVPCPYEHPETITVAGFPTTLEARYLVAMVYKQTEWSDASFRYDWMRRVHHAASRAEGRHGKDLMPLLDNAIRQLGRGEFWRQYSATVNGST